MIIDLVKGVFPEKERQAYVAAYEKVLASHGDDLDAVEDMEGYAVILVTALRGSGDFSQYTYKTLYNKVKDMKGVDLQ